MKGTKRKASAVTEAPQKINDTQDANNDISIIPLTQDGNNTFSKGSNKDAIAQRTPSFGQNKTVTTPGGRKFLLVNRYDEVAGDIKLCFSIWLYVREFLWYMEKHCLILNSSGGK